MFEERLFYELEIGRMCFYGDLEFCASADGSSQNFCPRSNGCTAEPGRYGDRRDPESRCKLADAVSSNVW